MIEIFKEKETSKIYRGEFIDKDKLEKYKTVAAESGVEIRLIRNPGEEVATIDESIILEKGQYFVGLAFNTKENYDAFQERVGTPQVTNG